MTHDTLLLLFYLAVRIAFFFHQCYLFESFASVPSGDMQKRFVTQSQFVFSACTIAALVKLNIEFRKQTVVF